MIAFVLRHAHAIDAAILAAIVLAIIVRLTEPFGRSAWLGRIALAFVGASAFCGIAEDLGSTHVSQVWPLGMHFGILAFITYRIVEAARTAARGHARPKNVEQFEKLRHRAF